MQFTDEQQRFIDEHYQLLPKDADGEYIHVGDVMEYPNGGREEVRFMTLNGAGWLVNEAGWLPVQLHHYHALTVEDVLREFAEKMNENMGMYTGEAIDADEWRDADAKTIAEYAKRLKLAEGEDA